MCLGFGHEATTMYHCYRFEACKCYRLAINHGDMYTFKALKFGTLFEGNTYKVVGANTVTFGFAPLLLEYSTCN